MPSASQTFEKLYDSFLTMPPEDAEDEAKFNAAVEDVRAAALEANKEGHLNSIWWYGRTVYFGDFRTPVDKGEGLSLLTRAAEAGHTQAQIDLAHVKYFEDLDYKAAATLYTMAARQGSTVAKVRSAEMTYYGEGVRAIAAEKEQALQTLHSLSAVEKSSQATLALAMIAANDMTDFDRDSKTFALLEKAYWLLGEDPERYVAEPRIYFYYGKHFYEGIGTEQDRDLGLSYLEYAAGLSDPDAITYLKRITAHKNSPMQFFAQKKKQDEVPAADGSLPTVKEVRETLRPDISQVIGWESISKSFEEICDIAVTQNRSGLKDKRIAPHFIVSGPAGSGKDHFIRLVARHLFAAKYLESAEVVTIDLTDIMTQHIRGTGNSFINTLIQGEGRIIVIKDSRTTDYSGFSPDLQALEQYYAQQIHEFLKEISKNTLFVMYEEGDATREADRFLRKNADIKRLFRTRVDFENFSTQDLYGILSKQIKKTGLELPETLKPFLINEIETRKIQSGTLKINSHLINDLVFEAFKGISRHEGENITHETFNFRASEITQDLDSLLAPLENMVGLPGVKSQIRSLAYRLQAQAIREKNGITQSFVPSPHFVFLGAPGTGKTTVARQLGEILKGMGYLTKGHVVETDGISLLGKYIGSTAPIIQEKVEQADGGILFIDEAYTLGQNPNVGSTDGFREEAIAALLKLMEDRRGRFVVIAAGYDKEMQHFLSANSGLLSRFSQKVTFESFTAPEMVTIFRNLCTKAGYSVDADAEELLKNHLETLRTVNEIDAFGNARGIRTIFETTMGVQAERIVMEKVDDPQEMMRIKKEDMPGFRKTAKAQKVSTDEILKPLTSLVGLSTVKEEVSRLAYLAQAQTIRASKNMPYMPINLHSLFVGPAGTGKTTVARLFGRIMHELGYLDKGHVVEVDKSGMTAQWLGQTGPLVLQQIQRAEGGILFIDEAYALNDGYTTKGYGDEAIATLLKAMEDRREKFIVIAAGYTKEMEDFLKMNSGLRSRFPNRLDFEHYDKPTLITIFEKLCEQNQYILSQGARDKLDAYLERLDKTEIDSLGNARLMRNVFEKTIGAQSARVIRANFMDERFQMIEAEDLRYPKEPEKLKIGFLDRV